METGSDQPQFVIDKLNIANNVDEDDSNPMGISLFANSVDVLAKLDLEYDSYANEFSGPEADLCLAGDADQCGRCPGL